MILMTLLNLSQTKERRFNMALKDLISLSGNRKKIGLSEERIRSTIPVLRQYVAFWREYPDLFVDFLLTCGNPQNFKFYFYQRVFLRAAMRHQYMYATFPRAYSKSFLSMLVLIIKAILYPRCKLFVTSGGKEQAAGIMREKVQELMTLIPALRKEFRLERGKDQSSESKDYCKYVTKADSYFDNIAARETSRGKRRHAGVMEECVGIDGDLLSQVIIPTMNVSRMCMDGTTHPEEQLNKSQLYITTAGYKNTYPGQEKVVGALSSDTKRKNFVNPNYWGVIQNVLLMVKEKTIFSNAMPSLSIN